MIVRKEMLRRTRRMTPSSTLPSWLDNMPSVLKMTFAFTVLYEKNQPCIAAVQDRQAGIATRVKTA